MCGLSRREGGGGPRAEDAGLCLPQGHGRHQSGKLRALAGVLADLGSWEAHFSPEEFTSRGEWSFPVLERAQRPFFI